MPNSGNRLLTETAYRDALREANRMNLTTTSPQTLFARVADAYPFHPDLRELVGKFKENDGFQQTRGVIRLMQMVVSNLWKSGRATAIDLIHPYDLDLNLDEIAAEIRTINPSLSEAIAHDVAHGGIAEVEQIDRKQRQFRCIGRRAPDPGCVLVYHTGCDPRLAGISARRWSATPRP